MKKLIIGLLIPCAILADTQENSGLNYLKSEIEKSEKAVTQLRQSSQHKDAYDTFDMFGMDLHIDIYRQEALNNILWQLFLQPEIVILPKNKMKNIISFIVKSNQIKNIAQATLGFEQSNKKMKDYPKERIDAWTRELLNRIGKKFNVNIQNLEG